MPTSPAAQPPGGDAMPDPLQPAYATTDAHDREIDAVLDEFGGDARAAIGALLHDWDALARDAVRAISHGFVRGRLTALDRRRR